MKSLMRLIRFIEKNDMARESLEQEFRPVEEKSLTVPEYMNL